MDNHIFDVTNIINHLMDSFSLHELEKMAISLHIKCCQEYDNNINKYKLSENIAHCLLSDTENIRKLRSHYKYSTINASR